MFDVTRLEALIDYLELLSVTWNHMNVSNDDNY